MAAALQDFLGVQAQSDQYMLVLPHFHGSTSTRGESGKLDLTYRGPVFAERDTRAAFYIRTLLQDAVKPDRILIEPADSIHGAIDGPAFLFGSRSNAATLQSLRVHQPPLVDFEFGAEWTIRCAGRTFSMADPSTADRTSYEIATDYGVVARLKSAANRPLFVIAGLGGRATEASARYLLKNWSSLAARFGERAFALVLEFPPPFREDKVSPVAEAV